MRWSFERVSLPEIEVVTLAEMKRHLREFDNVTDQDDDIEALIVAAREWVEQYTGRALIDQTWRLNISSSSTIDGETSSYAYGDYEWSLHGIYLRRSPVLEITSFVAVDSAGDETAVDSSTYELREADSKWPHIAGLNGSGWATGDYRITFRAGYADRLGSPQEDASVVPNRFKQAIKLHVEAMYDRDKDMMQKLLDTAEMLIQPERCNVGFA